MSTVTVSCHLIIGAQVAIAHDPKHAYAVGKPSIRVSKSKPSTGPNEIAIALNLELPISLFVRPQLTAKISIPAEQAPFVITPVIQENIAQQIREQTGLTVQIEVAAPEDES